MIVITGTPRSGTSLLMQTLKILGVPITGEKFSEVNLPENNPKGYYELSPEERKNLSQDYKGKAVKLLGADFFNLNPDHVEKIIYTTRNFIDCGKSFLKCLITNKNPEIPAELVTSYALIGAARDIANKFINEHNILCFRTTFERLTQKPEKEIRKICEFLDIEFNQKAVENVG